MILNNFQVDIYDKIESFKKLNKLTNKELGEVVDLSSDAFRMAVKRKSLSTLEVKALEHFFAKGDVVVEQMTVNDAFEMEFLNNKNANSFTKLPNGQYLMTMPLAEHKIQAGFLDVYQDIDTLQGMSQHSIIVDNPAKGRYIAFRVKGDSMDDGTSDAIPHNYIVSTRELQRQHWTSTIRYKVFRFWVIYTTESRYPLLKEIIGHDVEKGVIKCHSLNDAPEYKDFELSLNDVQALFYVIDVNRPVAKRDYY